MQNSRILFDVIRIVFAPVIISSSKTRMKKEKHSFDFGGGGRKGRTGFHSFIQV